MKKASSKAKIAIFSLSLAGCYHTNEFLYHDSMIKMHEYEMVSALQNKDGRKIKKSSSTTSLRTSDAVFEPEEPQAIEDKIVSINVTEETPIVDVIMELARMSGTDIQIDPTIVGGVNLSLKDKPLRYVFNRICGLTDTRYREKYGIVVFERDIPRTEIYHLDFLDVTRNVNSSITLNTSGLSSNDTGGGSSTVTTKSEDSFWDDIVKDIKQIIQTTENTNKIYTSTAERIQRIAKNEEEENKLQEDINNGIYNKKKKKNNNQQENIVTSNDKNDKIADESIRVNKRAGILTITASTKSHRLIAEYLKELKRKASAQVLIEMRFLEINLKKEYQAGINWSKLASNLSLTAPLGTIAATSGLTTLTFNKSISATANLFEKFGSTRTLANPRINAVNNQPALMTLATNYVYFKTKSTYTPPTYNSEATSVLTPGYRNVESESQTMPLGVIMSVLPSIDVDKREVILNIKPTISKLSGSVKDPAVTVVLGDTQNNGEPGATDNDNKIPVASVRELDTILKLKDGQTAVIGGFTERTSEIDEYGIPIVRAVPILGNLFNNKQSSLSSTETIILVKATIVDNGKKVSEYEKGIFDKMSDDPRMNEI